MIEIDGSKGSGGGQVLRTAAGLSAATGKPFRITGIRAKRPQPGMKAQHLEAVRLAAKLCDAKLEGDSIGSSKLKFVPGKLRSGNFGANISTAGSVGLLFQCVSVHMSICPGKVSVHVKGGGTWGKWAPPVDYIRNVLLPVISSHGFSADIEILSEGFYPKGGADVRFSAIPSESRKPFILENRGGIEAISLISIASGLLRDPKVAERQAESASRKIEELFGIGPETEIRYCESLCPGSGILAILKTDSGIIMGSDTIGERGIRAEEIGTDAAESLHKDWKSGACTDRNLADQLIPFMALCKGESRITIPEITDHVRSNIETTEMFIDCRFKMIGKMIICESEGLTA